MYKTTRDITLDVNNSSTQSTIKIQQEIADTYCLAIHITQDGQPKDLSGCYVQMKATKPDGTEVVCAGCDVSGDTVYYVIQPQFAAALGNVECQVGISESDEILYIPKFCCVITTDTERENITFSVVDSDIALEKADRVNTTTEEAQYVTPEMFGACGNGGDDSEALQKAFNSGKNVVFLNDYYITKKIEVFNKSNFKVYGNHHTVKIQSKDPEDKSRDEGYAFYIYNCSDISFEDLTIQSEADQYLIAIEQEIYKDPFKSSNIQGFKVQLTDNLSIRNYISYNLQGDISLQSCEKVRIDNWYSNNSLMGLYTSVVEDVSVSNFKIVSDPENTIGHFHAFYLCHGTEKVYISNGEAILENKWENVKDVQCLDGKLVEVTQRTPLFTIHRDGKGNGQKQIYVDNVKFTAQRIINVTEMIDTPVFSNCIFTTYYPEDALSVHSRGDGQITLSCDTIFNGCIFHLGGRDRGVETGKNSGNDYTILLNDCQLYCTNREGTTNDNLLLGFYGKFKLTNCLIEWLSFIRRLKIDNVITEFYNCIISIPKNRAVIRYDDQHITTATEVSIVNSFVNGGYFTWYPNSSQEGKLNIIGSNLMSDNGTWYWGAITEFPSSAKLYSSYHNDKKISTTSDGIDSTDLVTHMVDPYAHANLALDGNNSN